MSDAHDSSKVIFLLRLALKLAVHDHVDVLSRLDSLSIDELARLKFIHVGVVHEELEGFEGHFREERVPQSDVLESEHSLHIFQLGQIFILLDQVFDNAVSVLNVILHVFWEVVGSLEIECLIVELEVVVVHELVPGCCIALLSYRQIGLFGKTLSCADLAGTIVAFQVEIVRHSVRGISHVQRQLFL